MASGRAIRQSRFQRPAGSVELLVVRHGESEAAVEGEPFPLVDGHGDPALAAEGHAQAAAVADRLAGETLDAIYVTTLRRTAETAAPLAARLGIEPRVESALREVYLGDWEGGAMRHHFADGHPTARRMVAEERWDAIPGAEPTEDFRERVRAGFASIAAAHHDQRVVVVTHAGVIGELVRRAVDSPRSFAFVGADNASITHLVVSEERWVVRRFNDTAHLNLGFGGDVTPPLPESD